MATLKAIINKTERKTDFSHLVMIRITQNRKSCNCGLGIYVPKKDWNTRGRLENKDWIKRGNVLSQAYNRAIEAAILGLRETVLSFEMAGASYTAADIKERYKLRLTGTNDQGEPDDFIAFFADQLEKREALMKSGNSSYSSFKRHRSVFRKLKAYRPMLPISKLTVGFLEEYRSHLFTKYGNAHNSAAKDLAVIRTVYNIAEKYGLAKPEKNPFQNLSITYKRTHKQVLTSGEIQRLRELPLDYSSRVNHIRNLYLLQFYARGARVGDMMMLRSENVDFERGRIIYVMEKTGKLMSVKIEDGLRWVLSQYLPVKATGFLLPFLSEKLDLRDREAVRRAIEASTASINRELKNILERLGITKHITTHTARHSFASMAARSGANALAVQGMMGHSSLRETQIYMQEFLDEELDAQTAAVLSGI
ncbi:site-specific recombinase XerD [Pontibacter ummariensis]|uniref:Site-specific recombinase XerD n=1 Tax=Pontibacter ummariensis TaxID=1610492 RepID=A0A239DBU2_9BACT|nr:site-specific integrase [Pontibacter ummariensis]PRY14347.1 site-specific recombinase XerD [Pontibacter ummariensis]SNS29790.1 Site-specific recombinase XerD [Pontibacter ummariensis]